MTEKRVAFVTGGSRGIGAAIVQRLAKDGLHVVAVGRTHDKLEQIVAQIKAEGGSAEAIPCDIANSDSLTAAVGTPNCGRRWQMLILFQTSSTGQSLSSRRWTSAAEACAHSRTSLSLGKTNLPRRAGVLDGSERGGAGAAFEPGDGHVVRARL